MCDSGVWLVWKEILMSSILSDMHVEYLVLENGQRTGVVLSWGDYQTLISMLDNDPDRLIGLDAETLSAIAAGMLAVEKQQQLDILLERNQTVDLSPDEQHELDQLLDDIDRLNLLKARAVYTLKQSNSSTR